MTDTVMTSGWTAKSKGLFFLDNETVRRSVYETKTADAFGNVWKWSLTDRATKAILVMGACPDFKTACRMAESA
jgi:hypothetical protein